MTSSDEGFDAPRCDVVMLGSKTSSTTRYLQQCGRAMRPREGKTALILDLAGISHELGLPDETREWSLEDGEISDIGKAHKRPRSCARCYTAFYGRTCPTCQHVIPLAEVSEVETELEEAVAATPKAKSGGRRQELMRELAIAWRSGDPPKSIKELGERRGYKPGWAQAILRAKGMLT